MYHQTIDRLGDECFINFKNHARGENEMSVKGIT